MNGFPDAYGALSAACAGAAVLIAFSAAAQTPATDKPGDKPVAKPVRSIPYVSITGDDGRNLLITITARQLNPGARIVARCHEVRNIEKLRKAGAATMVQDEASCVVWGMPGAVATAGLCSAVLPLPELARWLHRRLG